MIQLDNSVAVCCQSRGQINVSRTVLSFQIPTSTWVVSKCDWPRTTRLRTASCSSYTTGQRRDRVTNTSRCAFIQNYVINTLKNEVWYHYRFEAKPRTNCDTTTSIVSGLSVINPVMVSARCHISSNFMSDINPTDLYRSVIHIL